MEDMTKGCIPILGFDSWVREPRMFVAEVLHNYARSSFKQSGIFKVTSYSGDIAINDSEAIRALTVVKDNIEAYLKRELEDVNVEVNARNNDIDPTRYDTYVTVSWKHEGVSDELKNINLNLIADFNIPDLKNYQDDEI